jgi:hypothetical protein
VKPKYIVNIHGHLHHSQDIEARIRIWRENNVRKFCALCLPASMRYSAGRGHFLNEDLVPWLKRHPDIIVGMGAPDMSATPDHPDLVDQLKEWGFHGLKCIGSVYPYNHWLASPQDGTERPIGINSDNYRPYRLDRIARAFPRLKIIGAHLGKPHADEALQMMKFPNVYFDFSGGSGAKPHVMWMIKALSGLPGANMSDPAENPALTYFDKLCFGTDNPEPPVWIGASERIMDALGIPDETREGFYWRHAAEIFDWTEADLA